jgi:hypothetical protein
MKTLRDGANLAEDGAWVISGGVRLDEGTARALVFVTYTRGAAGGACSVRVELSDGSSWAFVAFFDDGAASGNVVPLRVLEASVESVDASPVRVCFPVEVAGARWIRVSAAETGAVGTPGALAVTMVGA